MADHISNRGAPSSVFGEKYPYPLDGKSLMFDMAEQFAQEFNQQAKIRLTELFGADRAAKQQPLTVTTAYPTTTQACPRIAVIRRNLSPKLVGIGAEIETAQVTLDDGTTSFRVFRGQTETDTIEISICTLNERLRDDLLLWFRQWMLDAIAWAKPQLSNVYDMQCIGVVDDQVEYQGTAAQPGFEFYVGALTYRVIYDLIVVDGLERLAAIINWQEIEQANG